MQENEAEAPASAAPVGGGGGDFALSAAPRINLVSFKLRFASQREPGRSDVSAVKPLGLRQYLFFIIYDVIS